MAKAVWIMLKDRPLLAFEPARLTVLEMPEEGRELLPSLLAGALKHYGGIGQQDLASWINSRIQQVGERLAWQLQCRLRHPDSRLGWLDETLGLSLTDCFWISGGDLSWKDVSLYRDPLDSKAAALALRLKDPEALKRLGPLDSLERAPEWSVRGVLPKRWLRRDGRVFLAKTGGRGKCLSQAAQEWFAVQAADAMGLAHVPCDLEPLDGSPEKAVCLCPSFTDEGTSLVHAGEFLWASGVWNGMNYVLDLKKTHLAFAEAMGAEFYGDMRVFDAVIGNSDRHYGNFGMLQDSGTGRILGPAPLFDSGRCFSDELLFRKDWLEIFLQPRHEAGLEALRKLELKPHPAIPVPERGMDWMQNYIREGAELGLRMLEKPASGPRR